MRKMYILLFILCSLLLIIVSARAQQTTVTRVSRDVIKGREGSSSAYAAPKKNIRRLKFVIFEDVQQQPLDTF